MLSRLALPVRSNARSLMIWSCRDATDDVPNALMAEIKARGGVVHEHVQTPGATFDADIRIPEEVKGVIHVVHRPCDYMRHERDEKDKDKDKDINLMVVGHLGFGTLTRLTSYEQRKAVAAIKDTYPDCSVFRMHDHGHGELSEDTNRTFLSVGKVEDGSITFYRQACRTFRDWLDDIIRQEERDETKEQVR